ncbi:site-specific integrase (plasmid) [Hymenobacter sp. 5317J-9]|uniref:tyrosine-type recombinase/integrase n=1 Tax=Hymenobacter sp. 5317J-9 TaxID=2932250 RepID=UPI001FD63494|nr:tyrosine-type recombinase/integrase [Hymenobacter sp. 5317J-9]UOR00132.1 site-specific integrase [Hymenobacter sp. 5317J-9]
MEKVALNFAQTQGPWESGNALKKVIKQPLNRLVQPIEAALLHWGIPTGKVDEGSRRACISLLLHEMHRRQTSLWAWDESAWIEIVGHTNKEFKSTHRVFEDAHQISSLTYRQYVLACAYLVGEIPIYQLVAGYQAHNSAQHIFGGVAVEKALKVLTTENVRIGGGVSRLVRTATCYALLANRSPEVKKLTLPALEKLYETNSSKKHIKRDYILISELLYNLKAVPNCLPTPHTRKRWVTGIDDTLSDDWIKWLRAWHDTSPKSAVIRSQIQSLVAKAARWSAEKYPNAAGPQQWTKSMAVAYVAAVTRMKVGQSLHPTAIPTPKWGKPLIASYQGRLLFALRTFFKDCRKWDWFSLPFDPDDDLASPNSVLRNRMRKPRPIALAEWTRLEEAGLSLTQEDLPISNLAMVKRNNATSYRSYPLAMVRAMALAWLFTGLRSDEIRRLQVGCIRPALGEENKHNSSSPPTICDLTVPVGKSGSGFTKPIPGVVGEAIKNWEKIRPAVPKHWDYKTAEAVDFLFVWKGKQVGPRSLNKIIIPMLCRKAGVRNEDALGKFNSHRARHTLAFLLSNAPTPMSDSDLQDWLGQLSEESLRWYLGINIRKLEAAYAAANHISVDKRQLEQLKKPAMDGVKLPAESKSAHSVDLGHGFCTYAFFDDCKQLRPCTNCSFYRPKTSLLSQAHEVKSQFVRMLHHLPLSKEVRQAIEEAIALNEKMEAIIRRDEESHPG